MNRKQKSKIKVAIVCSPGGHLTQALSVLAAFDKCDSFLILQKFPYVSEEKFDGINKVYFLKNYFNYSMWVGYIISVLVSFFSIFTIFYKERPHIVFSTGAEIGLPAFFLAKLIFGAKTIFLESITRTHTPSRAAKALYPLSDLFIVQSEKLLKRFGKKTVFAGSLL